MQINRAVGSYRTANVEHIAALSDGQSRAQHDLQNFRNSRPQSRHVESWYGHCAVSPRRRIRCVVRVAGGAPDQSRMEARATVLVYHSARPAGWICSEPGAGVLVAALCASDTRNDSHTAGAASTDLLLANWMACCSCPRPGQGHNCLVCYAVRCRHIPLYGNRLERRSGNLVFRFRRQIDPTDVALPEIASI